MLMIDFILGASWASFVTTMTWRHVLSCEQWPPYSVCDHCRHRLRWWQLVPVIGWGCQRGRCWDCDGQITVFGPLSELITGLALVALAPRTPVEWLLALIVATALLVMATTDWAERWLWPAVLPGLLPLAILVEPVHYWGLDLGLAAVLLAMGFTRSLGRGDGELLAVLTLVAGSLAVSWTILFACPLALLYRWRTGTAEIPFVPCLAAGLVGWLWFGG